MDPDANLAEQLRLAKQLHELDDMGADLPATRAEILGRLAELVEALDNWITRGGSLPERWRRMRPKA